jgi:YidC/Oxa1 family membrane protein insertase
MERRVFIAIILSFLVLYAYQALFVRATPPATAAKPATATTAQTPVPAPAEIAPAPSKDQVAATVPSATPEPQALVSEPSEREITVDTATVQAVLTNRGGRLVHWRLKEYRDLQGHPVDLIPSGLPPTEQLPFALRVDEEQAGERLNQAIYRVSGDSGGHVDATRTPATVAFEYQEASGIHVHKEFRFDPSNYIVAFSASATNGDRSMNPTVVFGPGLGDVAASKGGGGFFSGSSVLPPEAILHRAGKVERVALAKISEQPVQEGQFRFAGVEDLYFMAAVVNPGQARVEYRPVVVAGPANTQRQFISQAVRFAQPPMNARFFVGPKQFDLLKSIDPELVRAVNFGMFGWLAVPLLGALKWIHGYVGNYGWSIILLTVLINVLIFPLRHKSVVSMRRMQALQPQLKAIQDRYANLKVTDPARQKMNTEVMNLYREKGVNPASGCIPILMTLPVLFAFYALLGQAIELRGAEFGWWVKDLSLPDPYYVIPILVVVTMVWQQKLTPAAMDPTQQKMMMFMPIMFGFIFLTTAAGTVLYWFVSNLWAIGQQYFTNWLIGPPVVPTVRPAAEKRLKNAGAGRTAGAEKHS